MSTVELIKNTQGLPFARIKEIGGKLILETINPAKILGRYDPKTNYGRCDLFDCGIFRHCTPPKRIVP